MATPLPFAIKLAILLLIVSEHSIAYMIPTYLAYMMEGFITKNHDPDNLDSEISYHAATLEGLHRLMSFFGCFIWGYYSDRLGRQQSLILVLIGISISSIGFGLAWNFEAALFWRCVAGICGGTVPITKAMVRDVSDDSNIAVLYSYFGTGHGFAAVLGPLLGGVLAHPYRIWPSVFDTQFFHNFPYFLPQLAHALITLIALAIIILYVPNKKATKIDNTPTTMLFKNFDYMIIITIFGFVALVQFGFRMLLSLWIKLDQDKKGLGWESESDVGYVNSLAGIVLIFFPLYFTPYLTKKFGVKKTCMLVITAMIPIAITMPLYYFSSDVLLWILLAISIGLFISLTTVFTSVISIAVSNSVSTELVGRAMGICQGYVALFRSIANAGVGVLFGLIVDWNFSYPFNVDFIFYLCAFVLGVSVVLMKYYITPRIEKRQKDDEEISEKRQPLLTKK